MLKYTLLIALTLSLQAKHKHPESYYRDILCASLQGKSEYYLPDKTRVDCLTDFYAIEVDFSEKWAESIGQSLHYGLMTGRKPAVYLIIESNSDLKHLNRLINIADKHGIKVLIDE